jgi:integral membrane protein (TIGR01906 family)
LNEEGRIPEPRALEIVRQIAMALECAERNGFVHRDIKPDNIMLTSKGQAKLADLGLAKRSSEDAGLTQSGMVVGTPHYLSPEQARGEKSIDIRVEEDGQQVPLFNERETAHLADVKDLFRATFRVQEASLAFALVYVVAVFVWATEASLRVLARTVLAASLFTLGLLVLFGVGALVGFDEIFLRFHLVAFTNDLWKLDPATDHLIQMFPHDVWFDATMLVAGLTALEATALASLSAAYLRLGLRVGTQPLAMSQPRA